MEFLKKNKIIVGVIVVIIVILAGVWFFMMRGSSSQDMSQGIDEFQAAKQISPEDIGLELKLKPDGRTVVMTLTKLSGIDSVEYELSYDAEESGEDGTAIVPKGAVGS